MGAPCPSTSCVVVASIDHAGKPSSAPADRLVPTPETTALCWVRDPEGADAVMEFGSAVLSGGLGELAGAAAIAALKRVAAACSDNSDGTPVSVPAGGWPELTNWAAANASVLAAGRGGIYETAFQTYLISPQGRSFLDHALAQALRREPLDPSGPLFVLFKKSFKQFHLEPHSSSTTILIYYTLLTKSVDAVVAHCLPEDFLLEAASESSALHQHTILCLNAIEDHLATIAASTESHRRDERDPESWTRCYV